MRLRVDISRWAVPLLMFFVAFCWSGCSEEDSMDIFVGRTWKVSNLFDALGDPVKPEEGKVLAESDERFYLKFETSSTFVGKTRDKAFQGTWSVDLKRRKISLLFNNTGNPTDALSRRVIGALQNVDEYDGTYTYLKLKEADTPAYILLRPLKVGNGGQLEDAGF